MQWNRFAEGKTVTVSLQHKGKKETFNGRLLDRPFDTPKGTAWYVSVIDEGPDRGTVRLVLPGDEMSLV